MLLGQHQRLLLDCFRAIFYELSQPRVRVCYGDSPAHDEVQMVCVLTEAADSFPPPELQKLHLLEDRREVARRKLRVRLENGHAPNERLDQVSMPLGPRLRIECKQQVLLWPVSQFVEVVGAFDHFALDQVQVEILDPVIAPLKQYPPIGGVLEALPEDEPFEGLFSAALELGAHHGPTIHSFILCFLLLVLFIFLYHHIVGGETAANRGHGLHTLHGQASTRITGAPWGKL